MRRPFIAGNWKMFKTRDEAICPGPRDRGGGQGGESGRRCRLPAERLPGRGGSGDSRVGGRFGAQNMYHEKFGAFTGEINAEMLLDVGCRYVILGHSERRQIFAETDALINRKVHAAIKLGLIPIVCVGETLDQRKAGKTQDVVRGQFDGSLAGLTAEQMQQTVIAYEPVWAIGTGVKASPEQAEEVHADLRKLIEARYNSQVASAVRIQYGGSVKPDNAAETLAQPNVDGALVGGAVARGGWFLGDHSRGEGLGKNVAVPVRNPDVL